MSEEPKNSASPIHGDAGSAAGEPAHVEELNKLRHALDEAQKTSAEHYNNYLRALAETENVRKRSQKEQALVVKFSMEDFFRELLPILDSFDKAVEGASTARQNSDKAIAEGITLVRKQLHEILERNGVAQVQAKGQRFDPNIHQAISRVESEEATSEVVKEEFSKGYTLHDRLLRPAMVSVEVPRLSPPKEPIKGAG